MEDKDEILIPPEKLQQAFDESRKQIEILLSSSKLLHGNYKYSTSIALSILALEEIAKLQEIQTHIDQKKGFTKKEWNSLKGGAGVHLRKLQGPLENAKKNIEKLGPHGYEQGKIQLRSLGYNVSDFSYENAIKIADSAMENLAKLNLVKQNCLYLDWKNGDPYIITTKTNEQLESFAYISIVDVEFYLYGSITNNANQRILRGDTSEKIIQERGSYDVKTNEKRKEMLSKDFQNKKLIAHSIFDEYDKS